MSTSLSKLHRKLLERTTAGARSLTESACKAALESLAVHERKARAHMDREQRALRARLRTRGRALGDARDARTGAMDVRYLVELAAYEHWHRLLFTRFLAENNLLTTEEASVALPGVFRTGDPVLDLPLTTSDQVELRELLGTLPPECFRADDALGWAYQFWQSKRKEEVNRSGKKIGASELSPVTQLFTEDYMMEFLLHNTLGAWWAGKLGPFQASDEAEARALAALAPRDGVAGISWSYLRFVQNETTKTWLPAAGTFDGWPRAASEIRLLDPCMGSGHFLVFALPLLVRLRMEEEGISAQAAVVFVLRENMFWLEFDERCTQIAAFNVALTAWKLAGYQALPRPNLACSGLAPSATEAEWVALAGDGGATKAGIANLYRMFKDAPVLGSLINPRAEIGGLHEAGYQKLARSEGDGAELAFVAQGLTRAAELLAGQYTLVITNVPFLRRGSQCDELRAYIDELYCEGRADLATAFLQRCIAFLAAGGTSALVSQQHFLYLSSYKDLRVSILSRNTVNLVVRLGPGAFETISGENVSVALTCISRIEPTSDMAIAYADAQSAKGSRSKNLEDWLRDELFEQHATLFQDLVGRRWNDVHLTLARKRSSRG